jgi:hypothetical protein
LTSEFYVPNKDGTGGKYETNNKYLQSPSPHDVTNLNSTTGYAFGMGTSETLSNGQNGGGQMVYIYTKGVVQATLPISKFVTYK